MINVFSAVAVHPLASVTVTLTGVALDTAILCVVSVSYTHLDVYKRQVPSHTHFLAKLL